MRQYTNETQLCFDDVLLVPQTSEIDSRKNVDLTSSMGAGLSFKLPIVAAPMDTVCEADMAIAMYNAGGIGIVHRYMSIEDRILELSKIKEANAIAGFAIGARDSYLLDAVKLYENGARIFLIDVANGHSKHATNAVSELRKTLGNGIHIMAGNVSTYDGFMGLQDAGADSIRVGIGGGSACTTRVVTGHGMPTLASIMDIRNRVSYGSGAAIVADGGIRNPGDAAKAFAAGADVIMLGGALSGTDESPGEIIDGYKNFRGMASKEAQEEGRGVVSGVEGISTKVPYKGSVSNVLNDFGAGLRSALSYTGVDNIPEFYHKSLYNVVTSSSLSETKPHALGR